MCKVPNIPEVVEASRQQLKNKPIESHLSQAAVLKGISDFLPSPAETWDEFPYHSDYYSDSFSELTMGSFKADHEDLIKPEISQYNELVVPSISPSDSPSYDDWNEDLSAAYVPEEAEPLCPQTLTAVSLPAPPKELAANIPTLPSQLPSKPFNAQPQTDIVPVMPAALNSKYQIQPATTASQACKTAKSKVHTQKAAPKKVQTHEAKISKRERNRLAAERYRRKGRELVESLTSKCSSLENENHELKFRSSKLEEEVSYLRDLITKLTSTSSATTAPVVAVGQECY